MKEEGFWGRGKICMRLFHKEVFVVKISIKGKDESSFHYETKSLNPALNSLREKETLLVSFSKLIIY